MFAILCGIRLRVHRPSHLASIYSGHLVIRPSSSAANNTVDKCLPDVSRKVFLSRTAEYVRAYNKAYYQKHREQRKARYLESPERARKAAAREERRALRAAEKDERQKLRDAEKDERQKMRDAEKDKRQEQRVQEQRIQEQPVEEQRRHAEESAESRRRLREERASIDRERVARLAEKEQSSKDRIHLLRQLARQKRLGYSNPNSSRGS